MCFLLGIPVFLPAQQNFPPNEVTFHASNWAPRASYVVEAETRFVEVGAVVRDSRGLSVGGLTREDFIVEDGGNRREITAFTAETTAPSAALRPIGPSAPTPAPTPATSSANASQARYLGIIFDDLSMGPEDLIPARTAARKFLTRGVSPGDVVAIFVLSKGQTIPFTSDMAKLDDALDRLSVATRNPALPSCPNLSAYEAYEIANKSRPHAPPPQSRRSHAVRPLPAAGPADRPHLPSDRPIPRHWHLGEREA